MITCPICQRPVLLSHDERDVNANLTEEQTDDFYCPTFTQVCEGRRWSHYWRKTLQGAIPEYCAYIPPFCVTWFTNGRLVVEQFEITVTNLGSTELIYSELLLEKKGASFNDFTQAIGRFKILVPFS